MEVIKAKVGRLGGQRLTLQKRLAMDILQSGCKKTWLDPTKKVEIAQARTREEIRSLISQGIIKRNIKKGQSPFPRAELYARRKRFRTLVQAIMEMRDSGEISSTSRFSNVKEAEFV